MKRLIFLIISFFFLLMLFSCSPQKRLNRLIKNNPGLITQTDTITINDTLITKAVSFDTLLYFNTDTVFYEKEKLSIQLIKVNDSIIKITGEIRPDTFTVVRRVPVPVVQVKPGKPNYLYLFLSFFAGFFSAILINIFNK